MKGWGSVADAHGGGAKVNDRSKQISMPAFNNLMLYVHEIAAASRTRRMGGTGQSSYSRKQVDTQLIGAASIALVMSLPATSQHCRRCHVFSAEVFLKFPPLAFRCSGTAPSSVMLSGREPRGPAYRSPLPPPAGRVVRSRTRGGPLRRQHRIDKSNWQGMIA